MKTKFRTNHNPIAEDRGTLTGIDQTVPKQVSSLTEIIYRFQGGIIPTELNMSFDPVDAPTDYIHQSNIAGFDITDAFQALQSGKAEYKKYITEKREAHLAAVAAKEAEFKALREQNAKLLKEQESKNN